MFCYNSIEVFMLSKDYFLFFIIIIIFSFIGCDETIDEPTDNIYRFSDFEKAEINENSDFDIFDIIYGDTAQNPDNFDEIPIVQSTPLPSESSPAYLVVTRIDSILKNLKVTQYVHYCGHIMDEKKGIYKYDCSGFVGDFVLKVVLKNHYNNLDSATKKFHPDDLRPRAWGFYDYFRNILGDSFNVETKYWKVFTSIDSLQKGDIIVVRYSDKWRENKIKSGLTASTGHVMIAWSKAVRESENKVKILITDCSASGHYKDTRPVDNKDYPSDYHPLNSSGIGSGWMWFGISTIGDRRPYKYQWRSSTGKEYTLYSLNPEDTTHGRIHGIILARPIGEIK